MCRTSEQRGIILNLKSYTRITSVSRVNREKPSNTLDQEKLKKKVGAGADPLRGLVGL